MKLNPFKKDIDIKNTYEFNDFKEVQNMTNNQCYSYGIMAIKNLKENNLKITSDNFYFELYHLWDIYSEGQIEQTVKMLEINEALL